jgi:formylglycine-generating enzyme required for sulfatase activity
MQELQHSVFFNFVVEGLKGAADQEKGNSNQQVSMLELYSYAQEKTKLRVAHTRSEAQTPRLRGEIEGDFDFGPYAKPLAKTYTSKSTKLEMVLIRAGEFQMGSPEDESERSENEIPHRVKLTRPFYLGKYEVTQAEFERVMGRNPSQPHVLEPPDIIFDDLQIVEDTSRFPVSHVSWCDALQFCNKLRGADGVIPYYRLANIERKDETIVSANVNLLGGAGYRLPTEAEWEYACRAGTTTPFQFGRIDNGREANTNGSTPYGTTTKGPYSGRLIDVGSYRANAWGLLDMHGNVKEWCCDALIPYSDLDCVDPPSEHDLSYPIRAIRGGGYISSLKYCRSANRGGDSRGGGQDTGLRVAKTP